MGGRKNPISHLSRIKNPELPCLHIAAALRAYSYVLLLRCFELLRNYCFLLWLIKAGVYYVLAMPCQLLAKCLIAITFVSHILTIPYILSLVLTIAIYVMPPSPLRPIEGVRGIYLS